MITWITENVAIGEYIDACNRENLIREKIDCILNLRVKTSVGEGILAQQLSIDYYHMPVGDHRGLEPIKIELRVASYMLGLLAEKYERILVHCTSGIDRAPFIVALYLTRLDAELGKASGLDKTDLKFWIAKAYDFIQEKRPQIIRHTEWV